MWIYNSTPLLEIPDKAVGFVYEITNTQNNKKYIGKKIFHFQKTIQKNLKKKKVKSESNWKDYTGSNIELNEDIKSSNPILIKNILQICYSKSEMSYIEAYHQFKNNVLLSDIYYNNWVSVKVTKNHLKKYKLLLDQSSSL